MLSSNIHLRPLSQQSQRQWLIGGLRDEIEDNVLIVNISSPKQGNYESLIILIKKLKDFASGNLAFQLDEVLGNISETLPLSSHGVEESHTNFLSSGVAFAVLRRISRESIHTARLIERAAKVINNTITRFIGVKHICLAGMDLADRPSIKVFSRIMLMLDKSHHVVWQWQFNNNILEFNERKNHDWCNSRAKLFRTLVPILSPDIRFHSNKYKALQGAPDLNFEYTTSDAATDLVMQNYDRCFLALQCTKRKNRESQAEMLRISAIASVNISQYGRAIELLEDAMVIATQNTYQAHLCYLQGLIASKRYYDLPVSDNYYRKGLEFIRELRSPEARLEEAWLNNGLALNQAMRWRKNRSEESLFKSAFALVNQAFSLVEDLNSPSAVYLRFNLIANSAFLVEMRGQYKKAAELFNKAFTLELNESKSSRNMTLGYRVGVLNLRAGNLQESKNHLEMALDSVESNDDWSNTELILRALGEWNLTEGNIENAVQFYNRGLSLCIHARAKEGATQHGLSLYRLMLLMEETESAEQLKSVLESENISLPQNHQLLEKPLEAGIKSLPSKLPAYIAELDLESLPEVDLNRFLPGFQDDVSANTMKEKNII